MGTAGSRSACAHHQEVTPMKTRTGGKLYGAAILLASLLTTAGLSGQELCPGASPKGSHRANRSISPLRLEIEESYDPGFISEHSFRGVISKAPQGPRKVHVVYLVPADKPARKDYQVAVGSAILHLQNFYQSQMGGGYSF